MVIQKVHDQLAVAQAAIGHMTVVDYSRKRPSGFEGRFQIYTHSIQIPEPLTGAGMKSLVYAAISNAAIMKDELKNWLMALGDDANRVEQLVNTTPVLGIVIDLDNAHKHVGYPLRHPRSKLDPRLMEIHQGIQLSSAGDGGESGIIGTPDGAIAYMTGSGAAKLVIGAGVEDKDGNHLGDLQRILTDTYAAWLDFITTTKAEKGTT